MKITFIVILQFTIHHINAFMDPLTATLGLGVIAGAIFYKQIGQKLGYFEGCEDRWITFNLDGLSEDLNRNVYGQEIALKEVVSMLKSHYNGKYNKKPLVLSFHGMPGTGKNYVSNFIMQNMFKKGSKSDYSHFYSGTRDFPFKSKRWMYQRRLRQEIEDKIKECHRSVFIFDEVEKMPEGILDVIYPYMRGHVYVEGVDYSKLLFILLSNTGQEEIANLTNHMWQKGLRRNQYKIQDFRPIIKKAAFYGKGGLHGSDLVKLNLIDAYIPFLPLEKEHLIQCIRRDIENMNQKFSKELIEFVLEDMTYIDKYSISGCKNTDNIVKLVIYNQQLKNSDFF